MMTLREFGQSIATYWDNYVSQVTTQNILDWSIGSIVFTFIAGFFVIGFGSIFFGRVVTFVLERLVSRWEKSGLPYTMERLEQRFGTPVMILIMATGTMAFLFAIGLVLALIEFATQ